MRSGPLCVFIVSLCGGCGNPLQAAAPRVHSSPDAHLKPEARPLAKASSKATVESANGTTSLPCGAQLSAAECEYVGLYHHGEVDSAVEIAILDDHTFCLGVMAGSADLQAAGYWELNESAEGGIRFREVQSPRDSLWVRVREDGIEDHPSSIVFELGETLQHHAAFGTSADLEPPKALRPIFGSFDVWNYYYATPPIERSRAKYVVIGVTEPHTEEHDERVRVNVYEVGGANWLRVDFDDQYGKHLVFPFAKLQNGELYTGHQRFGTKRPLQTSTIENARRYCIQPELQPDQVPGYRGRVPLRQTGEDEVWTTIFPVKTFTVGPDIIQGQPWFPGKKRERSSELPNRHGSPKRR